MKIVKFKLKEKFKYKRKVIIKDLIMNIFIGIHNFEKKKKQRVRLNLEILLNPDVKPNNKDLTTILNYEEVINRIKFITKRQHHNLLEDLAENIFKIIFCEKKVLKAKLKLEKLDIIKNSDSVGIEVQKSRLK